MTRAYLTRNTPRKRRVVRAGTWHSRAVVANETQVLQPINQLDELSFYRSVFMTMAEGVVCQSASGEIVAANPAAERIQGMPASQLRQMGFDWPDSHAIHIDGSPVPGSEQPAVVALRSGETAS